MASPEIHRLRFEAPTGEFNLSRLERVIYGPGKIAALKDEMERRGLKRAVVVTTDVVAALPIIHSVTGALGSHCASVFAGIIQHVPRGTVNDLQKEIERVDADSLVSLGGGSPIDSTKVAIYGLLDKRELVHIAVPTTLSAAEYTHAGGVTDETVGPCVTSGANQVVVGQPLVSGSSYQRIFPVEEVRTIHGSPWTS